MPTKSGTTYFDTPRDDPRDRIAVEIGDSKQTDFYPQAKILRWDNEVNVSIRLQATEPTADRVVGDRVVWGGDKLTAEFYPLTEGDGGFEIEIMLLKPPPSNVLSFSLVSKGVEFAYQPPLANANADGSTWQANGRGGIKQRPAPVNGSYAVYATGDLRNVVGGKLYRCGKVGHLFRPRIVDADGVETWGDLWIAGDLLTVTIPQAFLDTATYPIRHAAGLTFGYNTAGGSVDHNGGEPLYTRSPSTPASSGDVTSMTAYVDGSGANFNPAIYSNVSSLPSARLAAMNSGGTAIGVSIAWVTTNIALAVTSGTQYWLGVKDDTGSGSGTIGYGYDDFGVGTDQQWTASDVDWPATATGLNAGAERISVYATYTAGAPTTGITFVAAGSEGSAASGNVTPGTPAGLVKNDLLICQVHSSDQVSHSMGAGWSQIVQGNGGGTTSRLSLWQCRYDGVSMPSALVTHASGQSPISAITAWRSNLPNELVVVDAVGSITGGTDASMEHGTVSPATSTGKLLLCHGAADDNDCTLVSGYAAAFTEAGPTNNYETTAGATDGMIGQQYKDIAAGATGTIAVAQAASDPWATVQLALKVVHYLVPSVPDLPPSEPWRAVEYH